MSPFRLGFRVCDRRYPFLWQTPGQQAGRWNRSGDDPVHYLANTPTVAWAEWIRHQEIEDQADLEGVAAALWAVLIPAHWGDRDLHVVEMPLELVLGTTPEAESARLALVDQLKDQGAQGLLAPTAALHHSDTVMPLSMSAQVILLWCAAEQLPGWCGGRGCLSHEPAQAAQLLSGESMALLMTMQRPHSYAAADQQTR